MHKELSDFEVEEVKKRAREKLGVCRKVNDIIGVQIFSILGLYARVIYYPLGKDAPWGFTRISGSQNDSALKKPFVAINTSISIDCQVFAAAHELYHIWFEQKPDILPSDLLEENGKEINEKRANRFAAEFLVDEMVLRQELEIYKIRECTIKSVLQLADLFTVPYQAMAKRLREIGFIGDEELKKLLSESKDSIADVARTNRDGKWMCVQNYKIWDESLTGVGGGITVSGGSQYERTDTVYIHFLEYGPQEGKAAEFTTDSVSVYFILDDGKDGYEIFKTIDM